jgi:hypothetical protein
MPLSPTARARLAWWRTSSAEPDHEAIEARVQYTHVISPASSATPRTVRVWIMAALGSPRPCDTDANRTQVAPRMKIEAYSRPMKLREKSACRRK